MTVMQPTIAPAPARRRIVRVAHVITRLSRGGAQENTFQTVRLHDRGRFHADLIAGPPLGDEGSLEDAVAEAGIKIERVPTLLRNPSPLADFRALQQLTRILQRGGYDIVHTHTSKAGYIGRLAARRAGVRILVHTSHGNVFHGYFGRWPTALFVAMERHAARWSNALIELTDRSVDECIEHRIGERPQYHVIPSGIDVARFQRARARRAETRARYGWPAEALVVGAVARLEPIKGVDTFIRAAVAILSRRHDVRFVIAGEGSQRNALERLAGPAAERIQFLGFQENVADLMAALDLLVVPSRNEGMGRVILEAGAAGVPVVASRVGGIVDVVRDGETGVLVDPDDAEGFVHAIEFLLGEPMRRASFGANASRRVGTHYSELRMVQRIEALYETLLRENGLDH